jgi:membrane-anchored mycosin MYCP
MIGLARLARFACAAFVAGSVLAVPVPAFAAPVLCSELDGDRVQQTDEPNRPYARMQIAAAQSVSKGDGVTVAVIDAGVAVDNKWLPGVTSKQIAGDAEARDLSTLVAGLVGGRSGPGRDEPLGIAPGVRIVSVKVYDGADAGEDEQALTPDNIARGIDEAANEGAKVIDVSPASLEGSDALRVSVSRANRNGGGVIAAIGERPKDGQPGFDEYGTYTEGENVQTFPAAYPGVLGVGAGNADRAFDSDLDVSSEAIDVVAPIADTVSTTNNGSTCVVNVGTTAFAAAEVSGLAALLVAKHPNYNPAQIAAVIMETASGTTADRSQVDGTGVIQPNEAMTRQLRINRAGTVIRAHQQMDQPPAVPPSGPGENPFPGMRRSLLWWGVLAGGGLLLALLFRPLLRR